MKEEAGESSMMNIRSLMEIKQLINQTPNRCAHRKKDKTEILKQRDQASQSHEGQIKTTEKVTQKHDQGRCFSESKRSKSFQKNT